LKTKIGAVNNKSLGIFLVKNRKFENFDFFLGGWGHKATPMFKPGTDARQSQKMKHILHDSDRWDRTIPTSYLIFGIPGKNSPSHSPESLHSLPRSAGHVGGLAICMKYEPTPN
jgi:hypothetical protein